MEDKIKIGLAGDLMIGRLVNEYLDEALPESIWGDCLPLLQSMDLNLINLEAALTYSDEIVPKVFNFKADPPKVRCLTEGEISIVNLANNHILDFGEEGLLETLDTLDQAGIKRVGAGRDLAEAKAPVVLEKKGVKVGFLGCTDNEPGWLATQDRPGTFYLKVGDFSAIQEAVAALRPQVDLLILSIHWGPNMRERPPQSFIQFAHKLIESGVDVLHGHSAHIFQGIEVYRERLILYDTGDFVDDYAVDPYLRNDRSFFFILEVSKKKLISLRLIPTRINQFQVNRAQDREAEEMCDRMQKLSKEFHTDLIEKNGELLHHFGEVK